MEEVTQDLFVTFEKKDNASVKNKILKKMCTWMWDI